MTDRPFYAPDNRGADLGPRARRPGERVWTLQHGTDVRYAELRDNGRAGVELQIFADRDQFLYGRRFLSRAAALLMAEQERGRRVREGWVNQAAEPGV